MNYNDRYIHSGIVTITVCTTDGQTYSEDWTLKGIDAAKDYIGEIGHCSDVQTVSVAESQTGKSMTFNNPAFAELPCNWRRSARRLSKSFISPVAVRSDCYYHF